MIKKLLIANRGEIACRIIKTAKRLGMMTVAVYSEIDKNALFVSQADEAYLLGPAPASHSYLDRQKIIQIATRAAVDAIHPGYGFLSEDAEFARTCEQNNIIFVGPRSDTIQAMGDKYYAKQLVEKMGLPVIPSYSIDQIDSKMLPVLIKARAGGGGKGMRLITDFDQLPEAIQSAQREANASFGNNTIFFEKYISPARHVEVQIFSDKFNNSVYLFDRDCSLQRRHQKIIEEAPAPHLPAEVREKMGQTATQITNIINYSGAGTLEFLVDNNFNFYFMEMNTRLQVEHPVTEMITGLDLVEWQLQVAQGKPLPLSQSELSHQGHAFEARIYAEKPAQDFAPSTGKLLHFSMPEENAHVRIETGVQTGDTISAYYDPLIAKLIVWDHDRASALARLKTALTNTAIVGVETNVPFLSKICDSVDFQNKKMHTDFISQHLSDLTTIPQSLPNEVLTFIALAKSACENTAVNTLKKKSSDSHSPWFLRDHWRISGSSMQYIAFWHHDQLYQLPLNQTQPYHGTFHNQKLTVQIDERVYHATMFLHEQILYLFYAGDQWIIHWQNPKIETDSLQTAENYFTATMPGTIVEILVKPGQTVKQGDRLLTVEAMKMEHTLKAPTDGIVKKINYQVGDLINEGVELLEFISG